MFKFLVVEDHALVREGLMQTLRKLAKNSLPVGAHDSESALVQLKDHPDIELIVLDLMLPGLSGMALLGVLRKRYPAVPVVVLSALEDPDTITKALRAGASGYVGKSCGSDELIAALKAVIAGELSVPQGFAGIDNKPAHESTIHLTPTQSRVLALLTEGCSNQQIADLLGVTVGTVKVHFVGIFKSLKVNSRAQAMVAVKKRRIRL